MEQDHGADDPVLGQKFGGQVVAAHPVLQRDHGHTGQPGQVFPEGAGHVLGLHRQQHQVRLKIQPFSRRNFYLMLSGVPFHPKPLASKDLHLVGPADQGHLPPGPVQQES